MSGTIPATESGYAAARRLKFPSETHPSSVTSLVEATNMVAFSRPCLSPKGNWLVVIGVTRPTSVFYPITMVISGEPF
jgi:hypothetical protein